MIYRVVLFLVLLLAVSPFTLAEVQNDCIYYFYGANCDHCPLVNDFVKQLELKYPQLEVRRFEVHHNRDDYSKLLQYFAVYDVPPGRQEIPAVFIAHSYFVGDKPIKDHLEERIISNEDLACPSLTPRETVGITGAASPKYVLDTLTFTSITSSALKDSFKPTSLALLLILLAILFALHDSKKTLKVGLLFVTVVYIAFTFYGMGILPAIGTATTGNLFSKLIALVAVLFGILKIKGFFKSWKVLLKDISQQAQKISSAAAQSIVSPLAVGVIALIASLFSFHDPGAIFQLLKTLFADNTIRWVVWPFMLYYMLIFVLHLLTVVLIMYFARQKVVQHALEQGFSDITRDVWKKHGHRIVGFIISSIMLLLGLVILFA